jgi:starch phosphorylase
LFDIQVKRIHEYKRQHLNVLHILHLYRQIKDEGQRDLVPRTFVFGGKAAPGYRMAKLIVKLINAVAEVIERDAQVRGLLKVVFVPDFSVKSGQRIYPAADLSEQISTAGKEASGTGNMKFMMNGALTLGTLDGANVEIFDAVGEPNYFAFGKNVEQVEALWRSGYRPREVVERDEALRAVLDLLGSGLFAHGEADRFKPLVDNLLHHDPFLVCADFQDYVACQARAADAYRDSRAWSRKSIVNVARSGRFSSDRAVREYDAGIWHTQAPPTPR